MTGQLIPHLAHDALLTTTSSFVQRYPIQKKYHTTEFLRTVPHLRLRTPFNSALARFRSHCLSFIHMYFDKTGKRGGMFVQVQPPLITSSDCEGAGEVFTVVSNATASAPASPSTQNQEQAPPESAVFLPYTKIPHRLFPTSSRGVFSRASQCMGIITHIPSREE